MPFKVQDHYFKKAKKEKFLARSVYKLEEIDKRFKLIKKGDSILDLGYYPGSWIQYSSQKVGREGLIVGVDIKPTSQKLSKISNIKLFSMSAFDIVNLEDLEVSSPFDLVLSDMAPNTSGMKSLDQVRSLNLVECIFALLEKVLKKSGGLVLKVFDGHEVQIFLKERKKEFSSFEFLKPRATRTTSKEFFVIAKGYKGIKGI